MKHPRDIDIEIQNLEFDKAKWLRSKGWTNTSSTPGCIWLWVKKLPEKYGDKHAMVTQKAAIVMQEWMDDMEEDSPDTSVGKEQENRK